MSWECQTPALGETLAATRSSPGCLPTAGQLPRTPALVQLVEQLQQLGVHVVDGLEEGQHGRVIGDAAAPHVVALHAVDKRGDRILQCFQELLVVLLRLAVLVLLLEGQGSQSASTLLCQEPAASLQSYVTGLNEGVGRFSSLRSCQTQVQAPSYLNNTKWGRVGFPRLSSWLCEGQRC